MAWVSWGVPDRTGRYERHVKFTLMTLRLSSCGIHKQAQGVCSGGGDVALRGIFQSRIAVWGNRINASNLLGTPYFRLTRRPRSLAPYLRYRTLRYLGKVIKGAELRLLSKDGLHSLSARLR